MGGPAMPAAINIIRPIVQPERSQKSKHYFSLKPTLPFPNKSVGHSIKSHISSVTVLW